MRRAAQTFLLAVGLALAPSPGARADGLPVADLDTTRTGIESPLDGSRYHAIADGGSTTLLKLTREPDANGRALETIELEGVLAIPGVAFDGTTSGLSADGRTLTLIEPRRGFPRAETRLVVVDTDAMERSATIDLEGDFSFDAISPDGEMIYLIHYLSRTDPTRYEVRAYDLTAEKLIAEPIIDRRLAPEVMRGYPITRENSPDGTWAYTLYDGAGKMPFVHALNTAEGTALCIDLEPLQPFGNELFSLDLSASPDGGSLDVLARDGATIASIATGEWSVSVPSAELEAAAADGEPGSRPTWIVFPLGVLGVGLGLLAIRAWRRGDDNRSDESAAEAGLPADPFAAGDRESGAGRGSDREPSSKA